jgi:hypothetical protein
VHRRSRRSQNLHDDAQLSSIHNQQQLAESVNRDRACTACWRASFHNWGELPVFSPLGLTLSLTRRMDHTSPSRSFAYKVPHVRKDGRTDTHTREVRLLLGRSRCNTRTKMGEGWRWSLGCRWQGREEEPALTRTAAAAGSTGEKVSTTRTAHTPPPHSQLAHPQPEAIPSAARRPEFAAEWEGSHLSSGQIAIKERSRRIPVDTNMHAPS